MPEEQEGQPKSQPQETNQPAKKADKGKTEKKDPKASSEKPKKPPVASLKESKDSPDASRKQSPKDWRLFDEKDSRFKDLPGKVKDAIRKINRTAEIAPENLTNEHFLEGVWSDIASADGIEEDLRGILLNKLNVLLRPLRAREIRGKRRVEKQMVSWGKGEDESYYFRYLRPDEIKKFVTEDKREARIAENLWFDNFVNNFEMDFRGEFRPSMPDMSRLSEFYQYLEVRYGYEGSQRQLNYESEFLARQHLHYATKMINARGGDMREIIGGLQALTPTDFEYLATMTLASDEVFPIGSYAINLFESEAKNMLAEKMVRWQVVDNKKRELEATGVKDVWKEFTREEEETWKMGVMIEDEDILPDLSRWKRAKNLEKAIRVKETLEKEKIQGEGSLEEGERLVLQEDIKIYEKMKDLMGEDGLVLTQDEKALLETSGLLSKLEARTMEKLKFILKAQGVEFKDFELRKAVVMARNWSIHSLHLPCMVAFWGRLRPGGTLYTMKAPPFEDIIRVINNEAMLFERFNFEGKLGEVMMGLYRKSFYEERGRMLKITKTKEWKKATKLALREKLKRGNDEPYKHLKMIEVLEEKLGMPFTEMIRGGLLRIGGMLDMSGWRAKFAIKDELMTRYEAMNGEKDGKTMYGNIGLGFKLTHNSPSPEIKKKARKEKDMRKAEQIYWEGGITDRLEAWQKIRSRTPLLLAQLVPEKREAVIKKYGGRVKWSVLEMCLDAAQQEMVNRLEYHGKLDKVLLAEVLPRYLTHHHEVEASQIPDYIKAVKDIQGEFKDKDLEKFALHDWPLTMTTADIPWHQANWLAIGKLGVGRRVRDYLASMKARDAWNHVMTKPAPPDMAGQIEQIAIFRNSLVEFMGTGFAQGEEMHGVRAAEQITADYMVKPFLKFNENVARWIPGWTTLSGYLPESVLKWFRGRWSRLRTSYARVFYGPRAPAMDEFQMNNVLHKAREIGVFTSFPEWADRLRSEFKAGATWRLAAFSKYAMGYLITLYLIGLFKGIYKPDEE